MASRAGTEARVATRDIPARERLIVALDVASVDAAERLVHSLGESVCFYKIGMQLQFAGGLDYARRLVDAGKKVFLDAKLFDIGETVERAVANVAAMGVHFLTVHGDAKTVPAAVRGRSNSALRVLAVTVLTSLDARDIADVYGEHGDVSDIVRKRAEGAFEAGADGVIASGHEAELIRDMIGSRRDSMAGSDDHPFSIVTPGIRMSGDPAGDQKRVMTPYDAITAGADYVVMGRPIYQNDDPKAAAERAIAEIERAL